MCYQVLLYVLLALELEPQVLVLVLEHQVLVLVLVQQSTCCQEDAFLRYMQAECAIIFLTVSALTFYE